MSDKKADTTVDVIFQQASDVAAEYASDAAAECVSDAAVECASEDAAEYVSDEAFEQMIREGLNASYDAADLCVSEDLIARTLSAIAAADTDEMIQTDGTDEVSRAADMDETGPTAGTDEMSHSDAEPAADIVHIRERKHLYRTITGIAAAAVIGIAGIGILRTGLGSSSKSESMMNADFYDELASVDCAEMDYAETEEYELALYEATGEGAYPEETPDAATSYGSSSSAARDIRGESITDGSPESAQDNAGVNEPNEENNGATNEYAEENNGAINEYTAQDNAVNGPVEEDSYLSGDVPDMTAVMAYLESIMAGKELLTPDADGGYDFCAQEQFLYRLSWFEGMETGVTHTICVYEEHCTYAEVVVWSSASRGTVEYAFPTEDAEHVAAMIKSLVGEQ